MRTASAVIAITLIFSSALYAADNFVINDAGGNTVLTIDAEGNCLMHGEIIENATGLDTLASAPRQWIVRTPETVLAVLNPEWSTGGGTPTLYLAGNLIENTPTIDAAPPASFVIQNSESIVAYINSVAVGDIPAGSLVLRGQAYQGLGTTIFPDPELDARIRQLLAIDPTLSLGPSDVAQITSLNLLPTLSGGTIQSIEGLQYCTNLRWLYLGFNPIESIEPLQGLTHLETLSLCGSNLLSLEPLAGMTALKELLIVANAVPLQDIEPLTGLAHLGIAFLVGDGITALPTDMSGLTALRELYLDYNEIIDVTPLAQIETLEKLGLSYQNQYGHTGSAYLEDADALGNLPALEWLNLEQNHIASIDAWAGLSGLRQVRYLDLDSNLLTHLGDVSGVAVLGELRELHADYNQIEPIAGLQGLANLNHINLAHNEITDLAPLWDNQDFTGATAFLDVTYNPLEVMSTCFHAPALKSRGVTVQFDDTCWMDYIPPDDIINDVDIDGDGFTNFEEYEYISLFAGGPIRYWMYMEYALDPNLYPPIDTFACIPTNDVSVQVVGNGTVLPPGGTFAQFAIDCPNPCENNTCTYNTLTLTARPESGWRFQHWEGPVANPDSVQTTVTMDADKAVTATFVNWATLDVSAADELNPTFTFDPQPNAAGRFPADSSVTVTAGDVPGCSFDKWTDGDEEIGTNSIITVVMNKNRNLTAHYVPHFVDPNLEMVVRNTIHKPTGALSLADVYDVTWLLIYAHDSVQELSGIESCRALTYLNLDATLVEDLSPLLNLPPDCQVGLKDNTHLDGMSRCIYIKEIAHLQNNGGNAECTLELPTEETHVNSDADNWTDYQEYLYQSYFAADPAQLLWNFRQAAYTSDDYAMIDPLTVPTVTVTITTTYGDTTMPPVTYTLAKYARTCWDPTNPQGCDYQQLTLSAGDDNAAKQVKFTSWSGDVSSTSRSITLTLNHDYALNANFQTPGVVFDDDVLAAKLCEKLGVASRDAITQELMETIVDLDLRPLSSADYVHSLNGLQWCSGLTNFKASNLTLDLTPIASSPNLSHLEVWNAYPASVLTAFQDRGVPVQIILAGMKLDTYESQGLVRAEVERIDEGGTVPDPKERSFFAAEGTYLIITGNDYYDPQTSDDPSKIKELGEWKRRKGYYVITQRMYDIVGTGDADSEDIHTLIRHVYNHDPGYEGIPDLRYVLIVGQAPYHLDTIDPDTWSMMYSVNQGMAAYSVPSPSVYHEGSKRNVFADTFYTKGFYAIASDFDYSGVTIGRLAVKTTDQCRNAITKILRYDKGATGETDNWYGRALVLSYFEETTQNSGQESSSAYAESALTQYAALSAPGVLDESLRYNKDLDLWNRAPRFITGVWKALEGRSSFQFRQNKGGTWASEVLGWDDSYDDSWGFLNPAPNWVSNLDSAGQGGTLSIPMEETQDTIPLQTGGGAVFPSTFPYLVIVDSEFCRVTGKTDDTLTVERSQVPQEHEAGTFVQWPVILAAYMTDYTDTAELLGGGGCFPADFPYLIRIGNEICSVTDKNGDVLSLDRGTSPIAHATGTIVTFIGRRPFVSGFVDCVNDARKDASIDGEINAGVGLILHFDHGMEQSLAYLNYTTFHPQTYTNGYKTPLMMSMACADGTLREDCFGATFIHGFDGIRGGVGFLGSDGFGSGSNAMAPGFLMALFGRKISPSKWDDAGLSDMTSTEQDVAITWRPAQALLLGRILGRVDNWDHYNFQGDPETMLRTHIPDTLDLTDPPPSWSGQAAVRNLDVTVKWASGLRAGSPVYGALVSLTRASIQRPWVGFTDHSGHATIIVDTTEGSGVYDLVATSHDAVAYESQTQP